MTEHERIQNAGLTLVGPIVDGRFAVVSDGDFRVCKFDKKSRHGIRIGKTFVRSLDELPPELQPRGRVKVQAPEPEPEPAYEPEPEPELVDSSPDVASGAASEHRGATLVAANPESPPAARKMALQDKLAIRGAIRAWLRNREWRVGSHLHGESLLVSRPDRATFGARRWHVATVRCGVVTVGQESMTSRSSALALLGNAPQTMRLDGLPCYPAELP